MKRSNSKTRQEPAWKVVPDLEEPRLKTSKQSENQIRTKLFSTEPPGISPEPVRNPAENKIRNRTETDSDLEVWRSEIWSLKTRRESELCGSSTVSVGDILAQQRHPTEMSGPYRETSAPYRDVLAQQRHPTETSGPYRETSWLHSDCRCRLCRMSWLKSSSAATDQPHQWALKPWRMFRRSKSVLAANTAAGDSHTFKRCSRPHRWSDTH